MPGCVVCSSPSVIWKCWQQVAVDQFVHAPEHARAPLFARFGPFAERQTHAAVLCIRCQDKQGPAR
jgi:hypothetical protein